MRAGLTPPMYFMLRDVSQSFDAVGVHDGGRALSLAGDASGAEAERLRGHRISATALQAFGVRPLLGRFHTPPEDLDTSTATVLLSHALWQRRFGGDRQVVGRTVTIDGQPSVIIGVMPEDFQTFDGAGDVWVSFGFDRSAPRGSANWLFGVGRLKRGVSLEQAAAEVTTATNQYNAAFPERGGEWTIALEPLRESLFGSMRAPLVTLQAAVAFVLLIACANLAALLLTRLVARERELAIRSALGQSRAGTVRQLLTESLLLSFAGGTVGAFLGWLLLKPLRLITPEWFPRLDDVGFDSRVLLFSIVVCVVTAVPAIDPVLESVVFHLYIVSAIAANRDLIVALVTAVFAARDGRLAPAGIVFGCVAVGSMMLGHGVTTPGVFGRPMNLWIARLPVLALTAFAVSLACATRVDRQRRTRTRAGCGPGWSSSAPDRRHDDRDRDRSDDPVRLGPREGGRDDQARVAGRERRAPPARWRCTGTAGDWVASGSNWRWSWRAGSRWPPSCPWRMGSSGGCPGGTITFTSWPGSSRRHGRWSRATARPGRCRAPSARWRSTIPWSRWLAVSRTRSMR